MSSLFVIVGGGAAGFFAAVTAKANDPNARVILLEKTNQLLSKVKISGGGRCNVTHACFDPAQLIQNYPRGMKELLSPFNQFQPRDTIEWFKQRGVALKAEKDGRMFPVTDSSQTIIDCLFGEAKKLGVEIRVKERIDQVFLNDQSQFILRLVSGETLLADRLLLATGSSPQGHQLATSLGHSIHSAVPSLFTFNVPSSPLKDLSGIAVTQAELSIAGTRFLQKGPLLITHFGFSGPAALKLSAFAARYLSESNYHISLIINWLPNISKDQLLQKLLELKQTLPSSTLVKENPFELPKNLWKRLLEGCQVEESIRITDIPKKVLAQLSEKLHGDTYAVEGKTAYKEEFVTCGGVVLKEVNFKTMESRICPGLYFAGEVLDIDGITGGFNFQNAWTTGWIAGKAMTD